MSSADRLIPAGPALAAAVEELSKMTARHQLDRLREVASVLDYLMGGIGARPSSQAAEDATRVWREIMHNAPPYETLLDKARAAAPEGKLT